MIISHLTRNPRKSDRLYQVLIPYGLAHPLYAVLLLGNLKNSNLMEYGTHIPRPNHEMFFLATVCIEEQTGLTKKEATQAHELGLLTALNLSYSTNNLKRMYYDAFDECNNPLNKGELTSFCEMFFQVINKAQNDILTDLSQRKEKMEALSGMIKELSAEEALSQVSQDILFIFGQNYIFGIEGKGMTKQELISISEKTSHIVSRMLGELSDKGFIEYLKRRPIEVRLSESLCAQLQ